MDRLSVRQLTPPDFESIVDYFIKGDSDFLLGMGVDSAKLPAKEKWLQILSDEYAFPVEKKNFYYVIWEADNVPIGHSNINKIIFGEEAYMHLHMWRSDKRKKGIGFELVKMSIPHYFNTFKLNKLFCEPYALNLAPNKTLEKLGFEFIKTYETIPGWISFHQPINQWCLEANSYRKRFCKKDV